MKTKIRFRNKWLILLVILFCASSCNNPEQSSITFNQDKMTIKANGNVSIDSITIEAVGPDPIIIIKHIPNKIKLKEICLFNNYNNYEMKINKQFILNSKYFMYVFASDKSGNSYEYYHIFYFDGKSIKNFGYRGKV